MEKKNYIIVTAMNIWVSTLVDATVEDLNDEIKIIRTNPDYKDDDIFAYEFIGQPLTFKN